MVSRREGFRKVYDLAEKVIPDHVDTRVPDIEDWANFIVLQQLAALGVADENELGYARSTIQRLSRLKLKEPIRDAVRQLSDAGSIVAVNVAGRHCFALPETLSMLPLRVSRREVRVLSPFDNIVINRKRLRDLFEFDYQLECYVPAKKRRFGYFVLPLLLGDELIGRMDAKADRPTRRLLIKNLVLEDSVRPDEGLLHALELGINRFMTDNGCVEFVVEKATPALLGRQLSIHR